MEKIKRLFLVIVAGIIALSTFLNVRNQYNTLKLAEMKNEELKIKIEKAKTLKQKMIKQVEYATSSAFLDQQRKELLGLGTENDFWLELPENKGTTQFYSDINETKQTSNWQEWLRLFTQ